MLELLAAIQDIDPFAALLWSLFVFAAGMYPVGIMLGSQCSPCCSPCPCPQGTLPDTLTVTFKGLPDKTQGPDLCGLSFTSCFGSGAAGKITGPGGTAGVDDGPITGVSLTATGSGYAKYGRTTPTVTATGNGTGAEFAITLSKSQDVCSVDYWKVSAINVTKGGGGYDDGESLTFTVAVGDTEESPASATVSTTRAAPTLSVTAPPGIGGVFAVSVSPVGTTPETWTIESISVTSGGSGYVDNTLMTVSLGGNDVEVYPASVYVRTGRVEPTIALDISSASGIGATFSPVLTKATGYDGRDVWNVTGITITNAGLDYALYDLITLAVNDGQASYYSYFYAYVSEVGENGEVVAVQLDYGGEFFKDDGIADSVEVSYGGSYYNDDGVITKATLGSGGIYYREDKSATPYVAPVTVTISQKYPSNGSGAEAVATVASDPTKADFGKIASVTVSKAGDNYLAWEWKNTKCCGWYWDDKPVVVRKNSIAAPYPCELTFASCFGSGAAGKVTAPGATVWDTPGPIESVNLADGGFGYARLGRSAPTITPASTNYYDGGATFSVSLNENKDLCGLPWWSVKSVSVDNPGTGYENGAELTLWGTGFRTLGKGTVSVAAENGDIVSVAVTNPGVYYVEDPELPPYVADVKVGFSSFCPGSGAVVTPTIETNTASGNFGKITALTVTNAGDGYEAGDGLTNYQLENPSCRYIHRMCGGWQKIGDPGSVEVLYYGPSLPPKVVIDTEWFFRSSSDFPLESRCDTVFVADKAPADCSDWSGLMFTSESGNGATATVSSGGEYDVLYKRHASGVGAFGGCDQCCQGEEPIPEEITVTLEHNRYGDTSLSGDYVLGNRSGNINVTGLLWVYDSPETGLAISLSLVPDYCGDGDPVACDNCIKKCQIQASIVGTATGGYPPDQDMRNCVALVPGMTAEEQATARCQEFCTEDTPTCGISGKTFSFYDPQGAEDPSNPCAPNTTLPNHLNTFTLTVQ